MPIVKANMNKFQKPIVKAPKKNILPTVKAITIILFRYSLSFICLSTVFHFLHSFELSVPMNERKQKPHLPIKYIVVSTLSVPVLHFLLSFELLVLMDVRKQKTLYCAKLFHIDCITALELHLVISSNPAFFRCLSTSDLEMEAANIMQEARMKPPPPHNLLVTDPGLDRKWGIGKQITKKSLVESVVPKMIHGNQSARDCQNLFNFLVVNKRDHFCYPASMSRHDISPLGVPLLDFLAVDSKRPDSYKYPSQDEIQLFQKNRGIDLLSMKPDGSTEVEVRELIIGESSEEEIKEVQEWFGAWIKKCFDTIYPAWVMSVDIEKITISAAAMKDLISKAPSSESIKAPKNYTGPCYQWPVKFLLGDGLRYMLVITWPAVDNHDHYLIPAVVPQDGIINLLNGIPPPTGSGITNDIKHIRSLFNQMKTNKPLAMKDPIELSVLAVAAGWGFRANGMAALSLGVLGGLVDRISSAADGMWCVKWEELPVQFKIYALGDIKFGYMTYVVLSSLIIRDLYPDPDILSVMEDSIQPEGILNLSRLIYSYLRNSELHYPTEPTNTRSALLTAIKIRVPNDSGKMVISDEPSPGALKFTMMIKPWSSITQGGPRYLHQVRDQAAMEKVKLNNQHPHVCYSKEELNLWDRSCKQFRINNRTDDYCYFQQPELSDDDVRKPVIHGKLGLQAHPALRIANFVSTTLHASTLSSIGKAHGRSGRSCLLEYARLNPLQIPLFIESMQKNGDITKEFWLSHRSLYEDLRLMHLAIFNTLPQSVPWIECKIEVTLQNAHKEHTAKLEEARALVKQEETKISLIEAAMKAGALAHRTDPGRIYDTSAVRKLNHAVPRGKTTNVPFPAMKRKQRPSSTPAAKKSHASQDANPPEATNSEDPSDSKLCTNNVPRDTINAETGQAQGISDLDISLDEISDAPLDSSVEIIIEEEEIAIPVPPTLNQQDQTPPRLVRFSPTSTVESSSPPRIIRLMPEGVESDVESELEYFDRDGTEWPDFDF